MKEYKDNLIILFCLIALLLIWIIVWDELTIEKLKDTNKNCEHNLNVSNHFIDMAFPDIKAYYYNNDTEWATWKANESICETSIKGVYYYGGKI